MEVNYRNEDYISDILSAVICIIFLMIIFIWGIVNKIFFDVGGMIFMGISFLTLIIPVILLIRSFCKKKRQRTLNLFIMKNGECIDGKVVAIYDNCTYNVDIGKNRMHDVTAEIKYNFNGEEKIVVVNGLCISYQTIKKYQDKNVKIYVYSNMTYVDIIN